jgi:3',5'-cyclic AMP phosphodiesterase CpdA
MKEAKIAVLPDIHMRNKYREELKDELSFVVEELKRFEPDLVIALGDIIQHQKTLEEDKKNLKIVKKKLDELNCEKRYLAGNHDSINLKKEELSEILGNELWGSTQIKGEDLIFLNTSTPWPGASGEVTQKQLEFLEEELERNEEATIFVHHPIHYHNVQDTYWWTNYPERAFCGNKKEINRIISKHGNVKLVVNGHLHENDFTNYKEVPHITLNAFSKETREKPITGTYTTIELSDKIEISVKVEDRKVKEYKIE